MAALGAEGRRFESCLPDHNSSTYGCSAVEHGGNERNTPDQTGLPNHGIVPDSAQPTWPARLLSASIQMALGKQRKPRPIELLAAERGWVYFVQAHCGSIKIGRARDVGFRIKELQCANAHKLTLLAVAVDGGKEAEYHRRFAEHRLLGEWFAPHPDILAEIDRLT